MNYGTVRTHRHHFYKRKEYGNKKILDDILWRHLANNGALIKKHEQKLLPVLENQFYLLKSLTYMAQNGTQHFFLCFSVPSNNI